MILIVQNTNYLKIKFAEEVKYVQNKVMLQSKKIFKNNIRKILSPIKIMDCYI